MDLHEGQTVKYNGATTHIERIYDDGACRIANPDWDWDMEAECVANDIEYNVPYWIKVNISELSPL